MADDPGNLLPAPLTTAQPLPNLLRLSATLAKAALANIETNAVMHFPEVTYKNWNGYQIEIVGAHLSDASLETYRGRPYLLFRPWASPTTFLVLAARVFYAHVDRRAHMLAWAGPERLEFQSVGLSILERERDIRAIERARHLLRRWEGQTPGPAPQMTTEELRRVVVTAAGALWKRDKVRPSIADVARYIELYPDFFDPPFRGTRQADALGKKLKRRGLEWSALLKEAERDL